MVKGRKKAVSLSLSDELVKEMEKIREETGVPVSLQIELRLKGYKIVKTKEGVSSE